MRVARVVVTNAIPWISSADLTDVVTIKTRASNVFHVGTCEPAALVCIGLWPAAATAALLINPITGPRLVPTILNDKIADFNGRLTDGVIEASNIILCLIANDVAWNGTFFLRGNQTWRLVFPAQTTVLDSYRAWSSGFRIDYRDWLDAWCERCGWVAGC